jgi:predicted nucleic acid-binding protein
MLIAERFGFRIYDSVILAAAIEAGCTMLLSEDMQDGQHVGSLTIRNPFGGL